MVSGLEGGHREDLGLREKGISSVLLVWIVPCEVGFTPLTCSAILNVADPEQIAYCQYRG
jgi:hypothetical protein